MIVWSLSLKRTFILLDLNWDSWKEKELTTRIIFPWLFFHNHCHFNGMATDLFIRLIYLWFYCISFIQCSSAGIFYFDSLWEIEWIFLNCKEKMDDWAEHGFEPELQRSSSKIFEEHPPCKEFIVDWEPVSIVHYNRPGTCINCPLH